MMTHISHMTHAGAQSKDATAVGLRSHNRIISLDAAHTAVWAESAVTMDQLTRWTLKRGFIPRVVPEFKGITVGGAVMGTALESSSHRHGQFNDICDEYDLLLPSGDTVRASSTDYSDLFYGVSGSFGTIARLSRAKIQVMPAPAHSYVEVHYNLVAPEELESVFAMRTHSPDYLEAVILDEHRAVVISGYLVEHDCNATVRLDRIWSRWFCQHLLHRVEEDMSEDGACDRVDYIPLYDYLFRYDRAAFWMGRFLLQRTPTATLDPSLLFRLLSSWRLSSSALYKTLHSMPESLFADTFCVQDFYTPCDQVNAFIRHLAQKVKIYPLWLCPVRGTKTPQFLAPHFLENKTQENFINIGVYGIPQSSLSVPEVTRELEELNTTLGGRKMLYACCYYPEEEFWRSYSRERYDHLRATYGASHLPDLYARTHR